MTAKLARVFSGTRPSGALHIGNYFGAVKNWVELQDKYECFYAIVDYHAITTDFTPKILKNNISDMAMDLVACGIDGKKSVLFSQSEVPEHTELSWILSCFTGFGDLNRMTQFKEKAKKVTLVSAGLFNYPVLQAADILLYKANFVPIGEDQLQHLELAREIVRRFNGRFGKIFIEPQPIMSQAPRIMSLADPTQKMGKSEEDKHVISLTEDENSIWKKIKSAVTDIGGRGKKSPGVLNLFTILKATSDEATITHFEQKYKQGELLYADLKKTVYENLMQELRPVRERRKNLTKIEVKDILQKGKEQARVLASATLTQVKKHIGVI